ncbi:MAG: 4Fe-4S dicluster domain-containing protein [Pseudomonadota bacterium]
MPRENPHKPFTPDPRLLERMPERSGNAVNGLGEGAFRQPEVVYWATDMKAIAHGDLQRYFYERSAEEPAFAEARARRVAATAFEVAPVASVAAERAPEAWTAALDGFVAEGLCEMVGVAEMSRDWVYAGQSVPQSRVIVIGVQHDYDEIAQAPEMAAGLEVMEQYQRAAVAAKRIASWLRSEGWQAEPVTGPMTGAITLIPPALACGFGELGKHGSIINAEFGASFRLSAVLTDAPFASTPPRDFGVDGFCASCRICEEACPPEAIAPEKQTVRGAEKWYVDFDKCISFFNETNGCAICIAVCPWSRPGVGLNLAAKLARRAAR